MVGPIGEAELIINKKHSVCIPTTVKEVEDLAYIHKVIEDKNMGKEFDKSLNYFELSLFHEEILSNTTAKERAQEADLIIFIYNASQRPGSDYYKQFIENVRNFRPGNGGKTCFAIYFPESFGCIGYVPEPDEEELMPTRVSTGAKTAKEALARAVIVAYNELINV